MRRLILAALLGFSNALAAAEGGGAYVPANAPLPAATTEPTTEATAAPAEAAAPTAAPTAAPVSSSPSAQTAPAGATGTAEAAPTEVPTAAPTPAPTPTPLAELPGKSRGVQLIDPSWAIVLKAGAVLPLGDLAQYNQSGAAGGLSGLYHADADYSVDVFATYSSQGYKVGGGSQPLANLGLGLKLLYNFAVVDGITWYAGGGAAAYYNQRTKQVLRQPVLNNTPVFDPEAESSLGFGIVGTLGGRYEFESRWGLLLELNFSTINLQGGTSDNLLLAQPLLGLSYAL